MSDPQPSTITLANAPFDKSDADLILRSSDNVEFRVFKQFLYFASPLFEHMLTLPQPVKSGSNINESLKDDLPVIPLSEPSEVLEKLLIVCYPRFRAEPVLDTLEEIQSVLEAATKYDMQNVQNIIQEMLIAPRFVEDKVGHLRVFCIASRYGFKDTAMVAMRHTLRHSAQELLYVKELDHISAKVYRQLLDYHRRCYEVVLDLATSFRWLSRDALGNYGGISPCTKCVVLVPGAPFHGPRYWVFYMRSVKEVLRNQPCSASALRSDLLDEAFKEANNCLQCCRGAVDAMRQFTKKFADEIKKATSAVELNLEL